MRPPTDLPRRRRLRPARSRVGLLVILAILFVLFVSSRGIASFYTDYLWFDDARQLPSVWRGVLRAKLAPRRRSSRRLLRAHVASTCHRRPHRPRVPPAGPEEEIVERYHEWSARRRAAWCAVGVAAAVRAHRRGRRLEPVERVDPVPQPRAVRHQGPAVRHRRRLLRLPAAVPDVRRAAGCSPRSSSSSSSPRSPTTSTAASACRRPCQRVTPQVKAHLSVLLGAARPASRRPATGSSGTSSTFSTRGVVRRGRPTPT